METATPVSCLASRKAPHQSLPPGGLVIGLAVMASLWMGFRPVVHPIGPGLDPSWVYAFNRAAADGRLWGRECVSTYGPYGRLLATVDVGHLVVGRIVAELVFALLAGVAAAATSPRARASGSRAGWGCPGCSCTPSISTRRSTGGSGLCLLPALTGLHAGGRAGLAWHVGAGSTQELVSVLSGGAASRATAIAIEAGAPRLYTAPPEIDW